MSRPRVLLADDHVMMTEGLKCLLSGDFDVVGAVEDGRALVAAAKRLKPDVVVTEISMPHLNGLEAISRIKRKNPAIRVVVLTMHQNAAYARNALAAGASGYVVKHAAASELVMAIVAALRNQVFITPALAGELVSDRNMTGALVELTVRQREILQLVADGNSAKRIAQDLEISPRTVEYHKYQIMQVHDLHSQAELLHFAIKHGIVTI